MSLLEIPLFFSSRTACSNRDLSKAQCLSHPNKALALGQNHMSDLNSPSLISLDKMRICELFDLHKELVPFHEAWSWQKSIVREKKVLLKRKEEFPDSLIVLQHQPVYTLGTGSSNEYLNFNSSVAPYDIYRTERGGEVTYHGPGQLVMYPIMNLRNHKMDLHWYLRALEEVVIRMLDLTFSIKACRLQGFTGVWVGNEKIAAIGIRVSNWITYHGLAVNVSTDLAPFENIVPCGIRNCEVGSIQTLVGPCKSERELIEMAHQGFVTQFSHVFQLKILLKPTQMHNFNT